MKKVLVCLVIVSNLAIACLGVDYDTYSALRIYVENKDAITRTFKLKEGGLDDLALSTGEITLSRRRK